MFEFPSQLRYDALSWLGHTPDELSPAIPVFRSQADLDTATAQLSDLLERLENTRAQIESALTDSMAVKVGDLEVNYGQHLALLNRHGHNLTKQLSRFLNTGIVHSQFSHTSISRVV